MHPMMDPRRSASDAASYSSSTGSVWSTTDSVSFVYTDDVDWAWWGYEGIRGAVTRKDDKRDDRRIRFAAHFLRGPFAGHKSKKHSSGHRHSHSRDSDTRSNYSSSSGHSSSSRRQNEFSRGPSPMPPPPPNAYPGPPPPPPQHFDNNFYGPQMGMRPPPPPPMSAPPPQPGFEAGFIQIGGGGGGGPQAHDPWNSNTQYDGEPEVWD
ncbi:hypothetical protein F4859DRAFT_145007 [Xylaria cf. heliscus]|nr:hypothetical protein F4859DRAFT_145007 [Xylaria cf. heliscus]